MKHRASEALLGCDEQLNSADAWVAVQRQRTRIVAGPRTFTVRRPRWAQVGQRRATATGVSAGTGPVRRRTARTSGTTRRRTGAAAVTQITALAGPASDVAQSWLFYGLFFELAPLLSGLVLVARMLPTRWVDAFLGRVTGLHLVRSQAPTALAA